MTKLTTTLAAAVVLALGPVAAPQGTFFDGQAAAQQTVSASRTMTLEVKKGQLIQLPAPASSVFVADPAVADVQVASQRSVFVLGLSSGSTTLFALGENEQVVFSAEIVVEQSLSEISALIAEEYPHTDIRLRSTPSGVIVNGRVATPAMADGIVSLAAQFIGEDDNVINRMSVESPTQVNLRVRVAEMSREVSKELNVNLSGVIDNVGNFSVAALTGRQVLSTAGQFLGTPDPDLFGAFGGSFNTNDVSISSLVDALEQEGLITTLAEPNLTALSGETASFLAGGEFPIPVAQTDDVISIEFKKFGVAIDFVPTVLSPERISMRVRPEVSELSDEGAIEIGNIRIPALKVRRAETTVELGSGQSFIIGGLLENNTKNVVSQLPGLGDLPILGGLFRSSRFQRDETELVIIVTPYLVEPISDSNVASPLDGFRPATDLERIFHGRVAQEGTRASSESSIGLHGVRLLGDAGFTY